MNLKLLTDDLKFEVAFGMIAFFLIRQVLPKSILGKNLDMKEMLVLALCYGLFVGIRKIAFEKWQKYKKDKEESN